MKLYRGCLNIEIIDGYMIECHLRLNGDSQLYNLDFCKQLSDFFEKKTDSIKYKIPNIYIFPVFIDKKSLPSFYKIKNRLKKLLNSKKTIRTFDFDDTEGEHQTQLIRVLIFDTISFQDGYKLQNLIKCLI